jgi:uncharacterized protein DUF4129
MADSASLAGAAGAADRVAAAHQALLREPGLQFEFEAEPPPPELPDWLRAFFEFLGGFQPVFEVLFWAAIALLVGLILYFVARELLRHYRKEASGVKAADDVIPGWRPPVARARALLSDADRLAAEGRYAEAIHLLLFRSIEEIDAKRPHAVKPALTSRDILDLQALPSVARQSLSRLVTAVEWSFFGGRAVDAADFSACRRAYEEFAFPESWAEKAT